MIAQTLASAATLIRKRATACISNHPVTEDERPWFMAEAFTSRQVADADDAAHLASWTPDVALAVADWLDEEASCVRQADAEFDRRCGDLVHQRTAAPFRKHYEAGSEFQHRRALAVARAYLGEETT